MPPIFQIQERRSQDGTLVLALVGELDMTGAPSLVARLNEASAAKDRVVLDFADLEFMDSSGLRVMLEATAEASRDGWSFAMQRPPAPIWHVIEVAGVATFLPLIDG